jgi:hypothetical protein
LEKRNSLKTYFQENEKVVRESNGAIFFRFVVVVMACIFENDWNGEEPRTRAEVRVRRRLLLQPLNASSADRYRRLRQLPKLLLSWAGFNGHLLRVAIQSVDEWRGRDRRSKVNILTRLLIP